jgi:hypothetical protein
MNIFEGSRRIVLLIQAAVVLGTGLYLFNSTPFVTASFRTGGPGLPFFRTFNTADCQAPNARKTVYSVGIGEGRTIWVDLCFLAVRANNGQMLVPYKEEGGQWLTEGVYSGPVSAYTESRAAAFTLPPSDLMALRSEWSKRYWADIWEGLLGCLIALGLIEALKRALGWIVRGFLGIPSGADHKPTAVEAAHG